MAEIRIFTKRAFDERLLSYDVAGKLRKNGEVDSFDAVTAAHKSGGGDSPDDLTVGIYSTPISENEEKPTPRDTILNFTCSGGTAKAKYTVALQFTSDSGSGSEQLEVVVQVDVI